MRRIHPALILVGLALIGIEADAQVPGSVFRRVSRVSNFEFALFNNGLVWGNDHSDGITRPLVYWPRGSFHLRTANEPRGLAFLAKKGSRYLVSHADFIQVFPPPPPLVFEHTVPGRVGDLNAGYDSTFGGFGWRYVDDSDYIVYSSLDYDSTGVDISGNNYYDWPLRWVNGEIRYVADRHDRRHYPAAFRSDEDMFCVFKDTDTRADHRYAGPLGPTIPIGLEFHCTVFTWGFGPGKDMALFQYDIMNKSGTPLDSCFVAFCNAFAIGKRDQIGPQQLRTHPQSSRNLSYITPLPSTTWSTDWVATPYPPTVGLSLLETPTKYGGGQSGLKMAMPSDSIGAFLDSAGTRRYMFFRTSPLTDSILYKHITSPPPWIWPSPYSPNFRTPALLVTGPFPMAVDQSVRYSIAFIFSDSLPHLLLMDDLIKRMYANGFQRPSGPVPPRLRAQVLDRGIRLTWDSTAESSGDVMIPDSLGRPFIGYRLLRAETKEGPFAEIARWTIESGLVHEYLDAGGLKNNVRYYYRLLSFDEGATRLKLEPMDCAVVEGVNSVVAIPAAEARSDLSEVEVVPNPYMVQHEAQRGQPQLYFNYLPDECTIRIFTLALDHVKTIYHKGGSREEWDLLTEGGQLVASQLLIAHIEAPNGARTTKKFTVVVGR